MIICLMGFFGSRFFRLLRILFSFFCRLPLVIFLPILYAFLVALLFIDPLRYHPLAGSWNCQNDRDDHDDGWPEETISVLVDGKNDSIKCCCLLPNYPAFGSFGSNSIGHLVPLVPIQSAIWFPWFQFNRFQAL